MTSRVMYHSYRQLGRCLPAASLLLAGALFSEASAAASEVLENLNPYVLVGVGHDSNVFRVDDPAQAGDLSDGSQTSDSFWTIETGLDSQMTHRQQEFTLKGRLFHNDYDQFDDVDFTGGDARLAWDWAAGSAWDGQLAYEYRRALRDFSNQIVPIIDVSTSNRVFGLVARELSGRLRLAMDAALTETEFSRVNALDLRRTRYGTSLTYTSRRGNTLALDASYVLRDSQGAANLDYNEFTVGPSLNWRVSDRTRIRADLGYVNRDQDDELLSDYSGFVGSVSGEWVKPQSNEIKITLRRQLSSLRDEIATFALVTGISIDPTIYVGHRLYVGAGVAYEERDFRGEPDLSSLPSPDLSRREDKLLTGVLRLEWRFSENGSLSCELRAQDRDSNRTARDYNFNLVQLNFRVGL